MEGLKGKSSAGDAAAVSIVSTPHLRGGFSLAPPAERGERGRQGQERLAGMAALMKCLRDVMPRVMGKELHTSNHIGGIP